MKKVLLIAAMAVASVAASAQLWIGGEVGYTSSNWKRSAGGTTVKGDPEHVFTIAPEIGYDLNDTWSVAGQIGYRNEGDKNSTTSMFAIAPYVRYKALNFGPVTFFVDGGFGLGFGKDSDKEGDVTVERKATSFNIGVRPGIAIAAGENFGFVAHLAYLGYDMTTSKDPDDSNNKTTNSEFGLNVSGNGPTFGVYYNF